MILLCLLLLALAPCRAAESPLATALAACHRAADEAATQPRACQADLVAAADALREVPGSDGVQRYLRAAAVAGDVERVEQAQHAVGLLESLRAASYVPGYNDAARTQQRTTLHEVLQRPEFNRQDSPWTLWLRSAVRRLAEWLEGMAQGSGVLAALAHVMIFVVGAVVVLVGAWALAHLLLRRLSPERPLAPSVAVVEVVTELDADALMAQATDAARQGDWRMAVRHAFSALLVRLHAQAGVAYDAAMTRGEVRRVLPEALAARAEEGASIFEPCWYGGRAARDADFRALQALCEGRP